MKKLVIEAIAAGLMLGAVAIALAQTAPVPPPAIEASHVKPTAPKLNTARLWRLASTAQTLRMQANQTPQAKAADVADANVQAQQAVLQAQCTAVGMVLGLDSDPKSPTADDVICKPAPPPPPAK
jgi:hypothetical protein